MSLLMTIVFLAGICLLSYGAWLAYEPAGFVVAGTSLALVSVAWVRGGRGAA